MTSRSSTPAGRAIAEKSTANTISPGGSDSGYVSGGNTADSFTTDNSQDFPEGIALPSRRIFERKVTKLKLFDREIPQFTQHRFHDLHELFERPLCDYLIKAKVNPNPISIKLRVLGESEATAKPWIVVLCNKMASKKIRQFFNQQQIKAEYQPSNPDSFLPSFEIFVCNRPPRPMAGTEIYGDDDGRSTMCGRMIKVGEAHQSRFATLGGVIKVIKPPGVISLYGMTAGHILTQQSLGQDSFDPVIVADKEDEEDEGFYSGEEEYELDDSFWGDEDAQDLATTGDRTQTVSQKTPLGGRWPKIGSVSAASNEGTRTAQDLDWALIAFDRAIDYRPNHLVLLDCDDGAGRNRPLKENGKSTEDGSSRAVFLMSGTGGVKSGTLSTSLSYLMMGSSKAFTKTYTLVLPRGSVLNAGDCGSWVVDPSTCEVYGHVVASDAMGDTYVVPLNATLRDMEEQLGAEVSLPTEADIGTWLAQQAKAAAEQIIVPAKSEKKKVAFKDSKIDKVESHGSPRRRDGHSSSQASKHLGPAAVENSTLVVDYCKSCNKTFKGKSQDVWSSLQRHQETCSKHNKHAAREIASPTSQDPWVPLHGRLKSSSVKLSKDVQRKATDTTSTPQMSPVPFSIRSMYSNIKENPSSGSKQKDKNKEKTGSDIKNGKPIESASSTKPAATTSPVSTAKNLKTDAKTSDFKKDLASPPISRESPAPSSALTGRTRGDSPPAPIVGARLSLSASSPQWWRSHQSGRLLVPPPPRPTPSQIHGHESFHDIGLDSRHQSNMSSSGEVSYEGYTFTKCDSQETGQKETWAITRMVPMPVSQNDLKDQIQRNRKKRVSALDEYNDEKMKGFKRKQVDNLIRERSKVDGDYGFEYVLASIKLELRTNKSKCTETVSMQVILKRQIIAGFPHETSVGPSIDIHAKLPSQIMDLTTGDEFWEFSDSGYGSQIVGHGRAVVPFAGYPEYEFIPTYPVQGQFFDQGMQQVDNRIPFVHAAPYPFPSVQSPAQGMWQRPHPQSVPLVHQASHNAQSHLVEIHRSDQKKKAPKAVDTRYESGKKHDFSSDSTSDSDLSIELNSEHSWTKTDATPDTVVSGESREYREEKKYRKESRERSYSNNEIEGSTSNHQTEGPIYREQMKKEHRRSSLSPARRSRDLSSGSFDVDQEHHGRRATYLRQSHGTHYRNHRSYDIEPAVSFPANRTSRHRRRSVSPERPPHLRASSYDLDHFEARNSTALVPTYRRPTIYRDTTRGSAVERAQEDRAKERDWARERLRRTREEDEAEVRVRRDRAREREWERREREEHDARMERMSLRIERDRMHESWRREREEFDATMEKTRETGTRGIDRGGLRRRPTYDNGYMSGPLRDPGYYH